MDRTPPISRVIFSVFVALSLALPAALAVFLLPCVASADDSEQQRLAPKQVAFLLKDAGFPEGAIPKLVCTAKYESLYDVRAKNVNRNGSHDTGLFQINDIWLKECGVTRKQLLDPRTNVACARKVFRAQGYWGWYGYRYKQEKCRAFRLKKSTMVALSAM